MTARLCLAIGALLGAAGVTIGAYHAHGLEKTLVARGLSPDDVQRQMKNGEVAVRFQMVHALALLAIGLLAERRAAAALTIAGGLLLLGVTLFAGGLYLTALGGIVIHWAIVPSGGLLMIVGWLALAGAVLSRSVEPAASPKR